MNGSTVPVQALTLDAKLAAKRVQNRPASPINLCFVEASLTVDCIVLKSRPTCSLMNFILQLRKAANEATDGYHGAYHSFVCDSADLLSVHYARI